MKYPPRRPSASVAARLAALVLLAALPPGCSPARKPVEAPPPQVLVGPVLQRDVPVLLEAVGETRGSSEVELRARVEGFLESMSFQEGGWVNKGQLLYVIDPQPFEATLARARADLAQAEANAAKADRDVARYTPLAEQNAISRQELDNALSSQESARASVEAARATVRTAEIDLGYCRITAPESGLIGLTQVYVGNLVGRGQSTLLSTISKVEPIWVRFSIPEAQYLEIARRIAASGGKISNRSIINLYLADGSRYPYKGFLRAAQRVVDPATGSLMLEAVFPNPQRLLLPGQYGRIQVPIDLRKGALLVPQRAVTELQGNYLVTVLKPDHTVEQRPVKAGWRVGTYWVIETGLTPGDTVVVEGQMRLRPGMKVNARPVPAGSDSLPADLGA